MPIPGSVVAGVLHEVQEAALPGRKPVLMHVYRSSQHDDQLCGALLWIHGGGFVFGTPAMGHHFCSRVAQELGVVVVSVDYRLAPEHSFPQPLEDSYTGLLWLRNQADHLGLDTSRIAIGGESAGGGLAASLAQLSLDRGEVDVCFQLLVYPMLDDRSVLRSDHADTGDFVWDPRSNQFGWTAYLGRPPIIYDAPPYAAAARRKDLSRLPSTWIGVGTIDLFHEEDVDYAAKLREAGVAVQLVVVPGMYHGADGFPRVSKSSTMVSFNQSKLDALRTAIG
jgi:acetyl esterase/lipase